MILSGVDCIYRSFPVGVRIQCDVTQLMYFRLAEFSFQELEIKEADIGGAFHSTKNSGMKFRVFHVTNGTVFSGWFEPSRPSPSRTNFRAKIRNKQGNQKMADSLSILLALELLDDYEVEISEVLDEDDDITLFSVGSSYMRRNLNRVRDYFEGTTPLYFPD